MGVIKMTRVDARLVHGQVAARWSNVCAASKIIVLDDETAADPFMGELFALSAPAGTTIETYDVATGVDMWKKGSLGDGNIIVLFKTVGDAYNAYVKGAAFESLNIGQSPKTAVRKQVYNSVFLSDNEMGQLKELSDKGVDVYFHSAPEDKKVGLKEL